MCKDLSRRRRAARRKLARIDRFVQGNRGKSQRSAMRRLLTLHRGFDIRLGGSAVIDQAVVGGATVLITIILGRLSGPTELGLFALVTTIWYLALAFLESTITAPFTVYVQRLDDQERSTYAGSSISHVVGLSAIETAVIGLLTVMLYWSGNIQLAMVFAALTVTIPYRLLRQFARCFHYATLDLKGCSHSISPLQRSS